jgi:Ca2+-binding EF-hand superfamily protein
VTRKTRKNTRTARNLPAIPPLNPSVQHPSVQAFHREVFMQTSRLILAVAAIIAADSVGFAAQAKAPDPQKLFARKDANSDGFLSLEEYKTGMKDKQLEKADKRFKKIDSNGDGKVSFDEFKAGMPKPKE